MDILVFPASQMHFLSLLHHWAWLKSSSLKVHTHCYRFGGPGYCPSVLGFLWCRTLHISVSIFRFWFSTPFYKQVVGCQKLPLYFVARVMLKLQRWLLSRTAANVLHVAKPRKPHSGGSNIVAVPVRGKTCLMVGSRNSPVGGKEGQGWLLTLTSDTLSVVSFPWATLFHTMKTWVRSQFLRGSDVFLR